MYRLDVHRHTNLLVACVTFLIALLFAVSALVMTVTVGRPLDGKQPAATGAAGQTANDFPAYTAAFRKVFGQHGYWMRVPAEDEQPVSARKRPRRRHRARQKYVAEIADGGRIWCEVAVADDAKTEVCSIIYFGQASGRQSKLDLRLFSELVGAVAAEPVSVDDLQSFLTDKGDLYGREVTTEQDLLRNQRKHLDGRDEGAFLDYRLRTGGTERLEYFGPARLPKA